MNTVRRFSIGWLRVAVIVCAAAAPGVQAVDFKAGDDPAASTVWHKARASLFGNRAIEPAPDWLTLEAPRRAIDGAVVPIALRARPPAAANQRVEKLYLLIDANPSPISGIFGFSPDSGRTEVELRVRVDGYSHLRAIAETADGRLYQRVQFIKAAGGCSAPPGTDPQAALATLGRMNLRLEGDLAGTQPVLAQLSIQHPNHSGLAMDQLTRQFTPPHFVRKVDVSYGGRPVFSADVDFSMSENPSFRFYLAPRGAAPLAVSVADSQGQTFQLTQPASSP